MDMVAMGHGSSDSDSGDLGKRTKGKRRKNSNASGGGSVVGGIVSRRQSSRLHHYSIVSTSSGGGGGGMAEDSKLRHVNLISSDEDNNLSDEEREFTVPLIHSATNTGGGHGSSL